MAIEELRGPPPEPDIRAVVIRHYHDIRAARAGGWRWSAIGIVIGLPGEAIRRAFERVDRRIVAGLLTPPAAPPPSAGLKVARPAALAAAARPFGSNFEDLTQGTNS
ncbi:hypothetical protein [Acidiphilium acidophilum]|uniref:Uncharacterized protein n=1 Tax=Acidiphilium acidophilum TaxID=76588 RepID=A0AAW9DRC1_ACIAO|nr:hypothetical protein [Acidiphilium acidophilum]MDX5931754.1 hypothetical protein [Acidiphilium acidophilum]